MKNDPNHKRNEDRHEKFRREMKQNEIILADINKRWAGSNLHGIPDSSLRNIKKIAD